VKYCESVVLGSGKKVFLPLVADALRLCPAVVSPGWVNRQLRPVLGGFVRGRRRRAGDRGGYRAGVHRARHRTGTAISLDCDYVGTSAPPQIGCYDNSAVILPGADEVLKLGDRPWLSQVLNCAIDPA